MTFDLKYGTGIKTIQIPKGVDVTILQPEIMRPLAPVSTALGYALEYPLACDALSKQLKKMKRPPDCPIHS